NNNSWPAPNPTLSPQNPAWTDPTQPAYLKYMSLRPRPCDQLLNSEPQTQAQVQTLLTNNQIFPLPKSYTDPSTNVTYYGDVANLPGNAQHYDSVWMDLGYQSFLLAASGVRLKPLFAFLVVDMDGRVNYNVGGNVREAAGVGYGYHASNEGWGPWEVNPRQL